MSVFVLNKDLKDKMSEEEVKQFEKYVKDFESKRGVKSGLLGLILTSWWKDIEFKYQEVPKLLKEDLKASGDLELTPLYIQHLYGFEVDDEDIDSKRQYNQLKQVFFSERRLARVLNYIDYLEDKYYKDNNEKATSENWLKDLKSNKGE